MYAIGNEELEQLPEIGESVLCPRCGQLHPVQYGERVLPGGNKEPSKTLAFYKCGEKSYLAAINGKSVVGRKP
jgi:hypothetical protein